MASPMGVVGADEAGKGPVLGSMFAAAIRVPDGAILPEGIGDSKTLTPDRREELAAALRDDNRIAIGIAEVPVARIDDPGTDMNTLTVAAQASALGEIVEAGDRCVLDASDVRPARFRDRVAGRLEADTAVEAFHRADEDHPVVGAASIVAKVERDAHVAELAAEHGPVGSGYPSDPETRAFLEAYVEERGRLPPCARATWGTCADVVAAVEQAGLSDF